MAFARGSRRTGRVAFAFAVATAAACGGASEFTIPDGDEADGAPAADGGSLAESDGQSPGNDGGGGSEGGVDAGSDATVTDDAGADGSVDATVDASAADAFVDAGNEAGHDSGADAATNEAGSDASLLDAAIDGGAFDASADADSDAGAPDAGADGGVVVDGGVDSGADAGLVDAGPCPAPDIFDLDRHVYVDKAALAAGNGSLACPFTTLASAILLGSPAGGAQLTIHVNGSGGTVYNEAALVGPAVTLTSAYPGVGAADPSRVTLKANVDCAGIKCAVNVLGGTVEGITVQAAAGTNVHGIRGSGAPTLRNVTVDGVTGNGIYLVAGGGTVGPGVYATNNGASGLVVGGAVNKVGAPSLHVVAGGRGNRFNGNALYGIHVADAYANVTIEQADAQSNQHTGVLLVPEATSAHSLQKIDASKNAVAGMRVSRGPAKVADGAFDENGIHGLFIGNGTDLNATVVIDTVRSNDNGGDGVRLDTAHTAEISALTARRNGKSPGSLEGGAGLFIGVGTSAKVRGSVFLENSVGVVFNQRRNGNGVALSSLDVGVSLADLGGNRFAATPTGNNKLGGLCISRSGAAGSQLAVGNAWSACAPTQTAITASGAGCYDAPSYGDVLFVPLGAVVAPVDTGGASAPACTLGTP